MNTFPHLLFGPLDVLKRYQNILPREYQLQLEEASQLAENTAPSEEQLNGFHRYVNTLRTLRDTGTYDVQSSIGASRMRNVFRRDGTAGLIKMEGDLRHAQQLGHCSLIHTPGSIVHSLLGIDEGFDLHDFLAWPGFTDGQIHQPHEMMERMLNVADRREYDAHW